MGWRRSLAGVAIALGATLIASVGAMAAPGGNSAATITGSFADSCRDFSAVSSKDISHVVISYEDGRIVKDETITTPEHSVYGGPGDEISAVEVKSGTTRETFECAAANSPPTAVLEVKTPEHCVAKHDGGFGCDGRTPRTVWRHSTTALGFGAFSFFCSWPDDATCVDHQMPCGARDFYSLCLITYGFRGTSSTDPDGDIVGWSIDWGDGSPPATGDWTATPPTALTHTYERHYCPTCSIEPAVLTVIDSAGQADSDAQLVFHEYPD